VQRLEHEVVDLEGRLLAGERRMEGHEAKEEQWRVEVRGGRGEAADEGRSAWRG
jgi:hypothetical protein